MNSDSTNTGSESGGVCGTGITNIGWTFRSVFDMLGFADKKIFPVRATRLSLNYKIIHFVRHAEGAHNVAGKKSVLNYLKEEYEDATLSDKGHQECNALSQEITAIELISNAELVVISPMRRTLQTASLCFPQLINKVPWVAIETLREQTGLHPCDRRRPTTELAELFPHVSFSEIESDIDPLYNRYLLREPVSAVTSRAIEFVEWLSMRPEKEVIVVTHSLYLEQLLHQVLLVHDESPSRFHNCEMRSYALSLPARGAV